jgi:adenylate kinase family enzyme
VHMDATDEETYKRSATRNEGRVDDTPEIHAVRLAEYRAHVEPVLDALAGDARCIHLDGMMPQEVLHRQLENELRNRVLDVEITLPAMANL